MIAGFIHTTPDNPLRFDQLFAQVMPGVERLHISDAWLLDEAIRGGVSPEHDTRLEAHVKHLASRGASAILVTCSSIGEVADRADASASVPVLRVDRPMARLAGELALSEGGAIEALATLSSTLEPTTSILRAESNPKVGVSGRVVRGAIEARSAGDTETFNQLICEAVDTALDKGSVVVLAQATMSEALSGDNRGGRVLSSPISAVEALAAELRR